MLPKFSVELSVPPYILKTDDDITDIKVKITARYGYLVQSFEKACL